MRNIVNKEVEDYILSKTKDSDELEQKIEKYALENHIPIITKDSLNLLITLLKLKKPKQILEIGSAIGYSAIQMVKALEKDCFVTTIEKDVERYEFAKNYIEKSNLTENIRLIHADALEDTSYLDRNYDFIFIDAAKGQYQKFFDLIINNVNKECLIVSDNIFYNSLVCKNIYDVERRKRTIHRRMNNYLDFLTQNDKMHTSLIPIGDGVAITILK